MKINAQRVLIFLTLLLASTTAYALISPSYPYTLQNGATADATQVMADFNQVQSDVNANAAPLASPALTGSPTAPTAIPLTNSTVIATTAYADAAVAALTVIPPGTDMGYWGSTAPSGWVLEDGKTIGNASSNATERANADTALLFTVLWNSTSNTQFPILDSSGTPTTRGISAAVDFAANKAMPLPDLRGRAGAGLDNMGGVAANRLTATTMTPNGTTMGAAGGAQTHTLSTAELPVVTPTAIVTDPGHSHIASAYKEVVGGSGTSVDKVNSDGQLYAGAGTPNPTTSVSTTGITVAINSFGSGTAHAIVQPTILHNMIIKL